MHEVQEQALLINVQEKFLGRPHCVPKPKPSISTRVSDEVLMVVPSEPFIAVNVYSKGS